jgi:hypothetical protein
MRRDNRDMRLFARPVAFRQGLDMSTPSIFSFMFSNPGAQVQTTVHRRQAREGGIPRAQVITSEVNGTGS